FQSVPHLSVLDELPQSVRDYEPRLALDGGPQGLDVYRRLLAQAPSFLTPGGGIFMEIDPRQADEVIRLAQEVFPSAKVWTVQDLSGSDRLVAVAADDETDR
ncbi:MAG: protein-(glutamine-N5) methyltransferase, release factor-specific, partial [Chloroflexi bacterium]|nr:protein-(glutamine-N5) methyltransferase, release factor-specific [Chloroflexota bacterium]